MTKEVAPSAEIIERFRKKFSCHSNEFLNPWLFKTAISHEELAKVQRRLEDWIAEEFSTIEEDNRVMREWIIKWGTCSMCKRRFRKVPCTAESCPTRLLLSLTVK